MIPDFESEVTSIRNQEEMEMKFNYGLEKKKFDEIWNRLEKEYAAAGMSQHAIEEMKTYDWNVFKKERTFYRHNQRINEELLDCGDEVVGKEIGLKKYIDSFGSEDKYFIDRKDGWIEELDNEEIIIYLKASPDKVEILTEYVFNDKNQAEVAIELGISQAALSQKMKTIRKNLKKFI